MSATSAKSSRSEQLPRTLAPFKRKQKSRVRQQERQRENGRIFQCTFCCDNFRLKHDWARHESTVHLNLAKWACAPFGGVVASPTGDTHCVYCNREDPTKEHLDEHHHGACHSGSGSYMFRRKDHLMQHLRNFHGLEVLPPIDTWKLEEPPITSRCGFCGSILFSWKGRADHLATHFRNGTTVHDWKGDHGFEPAIAAQVTNALPPYLLSHELRSFVPFSATDPRTVDQLSQMDPVLQTPLDAAEPNLTETTGEPLGSDLNPTTYLSCLAFHLGRFAQKSIAQGIFPTDQMFQDESRRLIFGEVDGWEVTMADNAEWMSAFRQSRFGFS